MATGAAHVNRHAGEYHVLMTSQLKDSKMQGARAYMRRSPITEDIGEVAS
jgi:hypothetical protein